MCLRVKICGLKTIEQAGAAEACGADFIGLVMAPSRRQVTPETARSICRQLKRPERVGVFVNAPLKLVQETAAYCGFDRVQLHGQETAAYCEALGMPYIKSFVMDQPLPDQTILAAFRNGCFLVDSGSGSGVPFDWQRCEALPEGIKEKMFLAGGLGPENVRMAIRAVKPFGVDVSSGVETDGVKDLDKIAAFVQAVRQGG